MRVNISLAPYTVGAHTSTLNVSPFRTVLGDTTLALFTISCEWLKPTSGVSVAHTETPLPRPDTLMDSEAGTIEHTPGRTVTDALLKAKELATMSGGGGLGLGGGGLGGAWSVMTVTSSTIPPYRKLTVLLKPNSIGAHTLTLSMSPFSTGDEELTFCPFTKSCVCSNPRSEVSVAMTTTF
jgi:hypothetical protein